MKRYSYGDLVRSSIWSTLAGGAVGFALGLLLAPQSGDKARRRLAYRLENLTDQFNDFVQQAQSAQSSGSPARQSGDDLVKELESKVRTIEEDIEAVMREVRANAPVNGDSTS